MSDAELQTLLAFFKVLADESRLKLLGLLANRECSVEELAELLGLKTPTVSHHLAKMRALGLVTMTPEGNTHLYRLNADGLRDLSKDLLTQEKVASLAKDVEGEAWERKVLKDFFEGDRLKEIPASRKKREVILKWLAARFNPGERYGEPAVNALIGRHHPDFATLRRELIGAGLMARESGVYWRL
jgi:DNA-binding transcriptional ArsR family regulator